MGGTERKVEKYYTQMTNLKKHEQGRIMKKEHDKNQGSLINDLKKIHTSDV